MARESKFKQGQKVRTNLSNYLDYEVLEVLRNEIKVSPIGSNEIFIVKKNLFEVVENE